MCIPTGSARGFPLLHTLSSIHFLLIYYVGHLAWCEGTLHHSFHLHLSNNDRCWTLFSVFISHLYVFFGKLSVWVFFPLFDWVVFFSSIELYELLVYLGDCLSVVSFAIIFSYLEGCLLTLFIAFFAVQNLLSLTSHSFVSVILGGGSLKTFLQFISRSVLPMLSSRTL